MAAKYMGVKTVIAIDILDWKLELAKQFGASHVFNSQKGDVLAEIMNIAGRGATFAIDCCGVPSVIEMTIECIAPCGTAGSIGDAPFGAKIQIDALKFMVLGKKFVALVEGDSVPHQVNAPCAFL